MTLEEMLSVLRNDILHDRSDRVYGSEDHLWSNSTLVMYIDAAQRRFAKRTLCIRDGTTPSITQVTTVAYQKEYPLDPSVLAVLSIRGTGNGSWVNGQYVYPPNIYQVPPDKADLARAGHANIDSYRTPDTYFFNPNELSQLPPGKPTAFATDEYTTVDATGSIGVVNLRLYPAPSTDYAGLIYQMRVARLPQNRLTHQKLTVVPEIPEDYHLNILDYAAYLALRIVDHELGDPARAEQFRQSFEAHVIEAKEEMQKKQFQPMLWGFGGSGFSFVGN